MASPRAHRIHHSRLSRHHGKNFAAFTVWDRLFGTYCIEDDAQALPTGLDDERFDTGRPLHDAVVAMRLWVANVKAAAVSSPA